MFEAYPDIATPETAAKMIGCGRKAIYNLLHTKQLRCFRQGKNYYIAKIWLIEYIYSAAQSA